MVAPADICLDCEYKNAYCQQLEDKIVLLECQLQNARELSIYSPNRSQRKQYLAKEIHENSQNNTVLSGDNVSEENSETDGICEISK